MPPECTRDCWHGDQVVYCGPACQKTHWKAGHKAVCSTRGVPSSQPDASTRVRPGMEGQEHALASEVSLYVYDLSRGFAKRMSQMLLGKQVDGVWHTGVVVYGKEFFYGGGIQSGESWRSSAAITMHQEDRTGPLIRLPTAGDPGETPYGAPVQRVSLGETTKSLDNFLKFLEVCACVCVCLSVCARAR